jgi:hypothetical protein
MASGHQTRTTHARWLIGFSEAEASVQALAGRRQSEYDRPEHRERAAEALRAAAQRRPSFGLDGVVSEAPPEIAARQEALAQEPGLAEAFATGIRIGLVDLRRVCALQSGVMVDQPAPDLDPGDLDAILTYTIRPPERPAVDVQYDSARKAWVILAPDPNLRVVGEFRTDLQEGAIGLGFELRQFGSSVRAVRHHDRWVLVDGYHRAVGLLARGINVVPALVGDAPTEALVKGAAGIRPEVFLGPRPPMLPDFWDDEVSAEVDLPATTRVLLVEALDVRAFG